MSYLTTKTAILALATVFVAAQSDKYQIQPGSVPLSTRKSWCQSEVTTCPLICRDQSQTGAKENMCDPNTLQYQCLCGDNNTPDLSEYSLTLPYFICTEWGTQCVQKCVNNNNCAAHCREDNICGAKNPRPPNNTVPATPGEATPDATPDATQIFKGPGDDMKSISSIAEPCNKGRLYAMTSALGLLLVGFTYML